MHAARAALQGSRNRYYVKWRARLVDVVRRSIEGRGRGKSPRRRAKCVSLSLTLPQNRSNFFGALQHFIPCKCYPLPLFRRKLSRTMFQRDIKQPLALIIGTTMTMGIFAVFVFVVWVISSLTEQGGIRQNDATRKDKTVGH